MPLNGFSEIYQLCEDKDKKNPGFNCVRSLNAVRDLMLLELMQDKDDSSGRISWDSQIEQWWDSTHLSDKNILRQRPCYFLLASLKEQLMEKREKKVKAWF